MNRKEFLELVARGAVALGATAVPWARLRAESPGPVMTALNRNNAIAFHVPFHLRVFMRTSSPNYTSDRKPVLSPTVSCGIPDFPKIVISRFDMGVFSGYLI